MDYAKKLRSRSGPRAKDSESANSGLIGLVLLIAIVVTVPPIIILTQTSQPAHDKIPITYLGISKNDNFIDIFNKAGDDIPKESIAILVNGVDRTKNFLKSKNSPDWGTLSAGEHIYYQSPQEPRSVQIFYVDNSGQHLLASSEPTAISAQRSDSTLPVVMKQPGMQMAPESAAVQEVALMAGGGNQGTPVGGFEADLTGATPIADFMATPTSGSTPLTVLFYDTSTNYPVSWEWTFGDGSTANIQNPSHLYTNPGTYPVTLTVTNADGSDGESKDDYIRVMPAGSPGLPTAQFIASPQNGQIPLTVQFTDQSVSEGTTLYKWDVDNDGIVDYTVKNPVHLYQTAGTYTVKLTVTNASGSDGESKADYIRVTSPGSPAFPTAQFIASPQQGQIPLTVQFTDQSVSAGSTLYKWDVNNDGIVDYTVKNPVHLYRTAGTYPVKLTVTNATGSDSESKTDFIRVTSPGSMTLPTAQFTASPQQGQIPLTVQFTDQSVSAGTTSYQWDVNSDGIIDYTAKNPVHIYRTAGTYPVKLTVTNATGSDSESKTDYISVTSPGSPTLPTARFIASPQQGQIPLTVQFTDQSVSAGTTSYQWDVNSDGIIDYTAKNPVHIYRTAGTYPVKLTVTNATGSDSESKTDYISVSSQGSPTLPTAQFTASPQQGQVPLTVQFTDQSVSAGTTSYQWDVNNDGIIDYTAKNPVHTYRTAGTYTVKLTVTNTAGSDSEIKTNYITLLSGGSSSLNLADFGIKGDGTDEGPAIQTAFNYAASHAIKTVIFPAGRIITTGSLRIPEGLTLIGNGCTLRLKANAHTDTSPWTWIYVQEGCRVSGFKFDGNRFNGNGMNTNGLMLQGDNIFDSNEVYNVNSYAVFVYGSYPTNIRITNNNIHNIKQYGIDTGGSDGPSSWGYNIVVSGNTIADCGEVAVKIRGTKDSTISNNNIKVGARNPGGDQPSGIRLYSWDETNTNVKIANNIVTGIDQNPSTCIDSDDSDNHGISITGNTVSHCHDGIEIQFSNGIITGNTISDCVNDLTNNGNGNTISNNNILNN